MHVGVGVGGHGWVGEWQCARACSTWRLTRTVPARQNWMQGKEDAVSYTDPGPPAVPQLLHAAQPG